MDRLETGGTSDTHRRRGMAQPNADATEYAAMEKDGIVGSSHEHAPAAESHTRSLLKGLTWRILATTTTTVIAYLITGKIDSALRIGLFEFFAKLGIYYAHERLWTQIRI